MFCKNFSWLKWKRSRLCKTFYTWFWTVVVSNIKFWSFKLTVGYSLYGQMNFNCISYSLPKNKMLSNEHIFSIASNSKIRDPFQSFCLPTHDYSFQLKTTLFLFVAFCLRFNERHKKYDNGTRSIHTRFG